ncbi:MAG: discoidin domain-containing protein [Kiritimatiellae bacterium]|nr:discoidin domain-containing protein [Kiritimatiellia bacterium]
MKRFLSAVAAFSAAAWAGYAQEILREGDASYASYTPWSKARTFGADGKVVRRGDQSRIMQNRPIYLVDKKSFPLPTNDWWTDALVSRWTGNLWSYPAKVVIGASGVRVAFPTYWIDNGTEVKERSAVVVGAKGAFNPDATLVESWHDWDVEMVLRDDAKSMRTTLVHGSPFTWIEYSGVKVAVTPENGPGEVVEKSAGGYVLKVGDDHYGVWEDGRSYVVIGLLPSRADFSRLAPYATAIIRSTRVDWKYDEKTAELTTTWNVKTEDLTGKAKNPIALQGFQPHHLRRTRPQFKTMDGISWLTPRGEQRIAAGNSLSIVYDFPGLLPCWAAPREGDSAASPYRADLFRRLLADYAARGNFGGDTYWGGKGLFQMAGAMMAAREIGDAATFAKARDRLRAQFEDWLTWTPGEDKFYFSYIPRWGGLVGENTSYDSDAFNDHHFHYGYFTWSGALLCLVDEDFKARFGGMLKLIAKDYANWDRTDKRFPLFRTFDPWAGHSFAGGIGDGAGNGQESSSEAMQGWGGLYLVGLALGDDDMRDAGIFGYVSEARGTAEYWFDRDRKNIDYTKYTKPYNSNLTCHGVGWWTYFSGDPVWMHSIQWLPNSPALDYLSEDLKFAKWDYDTMWGSKHVSGWDGELGNASLGNVVLSYLQRSDPEQAAAIFDKLEREGRGVVKNADTGHLTYWATHSHLSWGELDFSVRADFPAARAFVKNGKRTYMAWNAGKAPRKVRFFDAKGATLFTLDAAPGVLSVSGRARQAVLSLPAWDAAAVPKKNVSAPAPEEKLEVVSFSLGPKSIELAVGHSFKLTPSAKDQFGGAMPVKGVKLVRKPAFCSLKKGGLLVADAAGEGELTISLGGKEATMRVSAKPLSEIDLARGRAARASSQENAGLGAENAVDGDPKTRWGSAHKDGEWIEVDLGDVYTVNRVVLVWENARATDYDIEVSADGEKWTTAASVRGGKGGTETVELKPSAARKLRVKGLRRNTGYGISLFSLSVYGSQDKPDKK